VYEGKTVTIMDESPCKAPY